MKTITAPVAARTAPFEFRRVAFLVEVTSFRAATLGQLLTGITLAPGESIFYHLHRRFFAAPDHLPEYPNDFAAWSDEMLGDPVLAERLANLNLFRSADVGTVRREISVILAEQLRDVGDARRAIAAAEFAFCRPRVVELGSDTHAATPTEFLDILRHIDPSSIGHHLFTPKASGRVNDFSAWFEALGYASLARQLDTFDPYLNSLEDNRAYLIELVEMGLKQPGVTHA
jgi:hypothetical protein